MAGEARFKVPWRRVHPDHERPSTRQLEPAAQCQTSLRFVNLFVCEIPTASAQLLGCAELGLVERILVSSGDDPSERWERNEVHSLLAGQGFDTEERGTALLFGRVNARREYLRPVEIRA